MRLEVKGLNKSFGEKQVLHDVSFKVDNGRALGFLGRNGAGKTTTIRIIMDVFKADSGQVLLDGKKFIRSDYKVGYLPEERGMYQEINLLDQLIYFGQLKGMTKEAAKESALNGLKRMELDSYANKKLKTLSKGNQQKVQILQAVIDDPDIVIFDEPFSGLDPVNSLVLQDIIKEFIDKDRLVIFSSHQMSSVEKFCDDIVIIKNGSIALEGDLDAIKSEKGKDIYSLELEDYSNIDSINTIPEVLEYVENNNKILIKVKDNYDSNNLLKSLLNLDFKILKFEPYRPSLETIFIELDKGELI